jgi:hypothetical protein
MALDQLPPTTTGRSLLYDALAQNDVDMANHRLLNLDTSNLPPVGIPPTIVCAAHKWLNGWNATTQEWHQDQPAFADIGAFLTRPQMQHINEVGTVRLGHWEASSIEPNFLPTLDLIRHPVANVSMSGRKLTDVGMPVNDGDAVNKGFMDFLLQGLNPKQAVRCATTTRITRSGAPKVIDGITAVAGDRVLVKNQPGDDPLSTNGEENGIFIVASGTWGRSDDTNSDNFNHLAYCTVLEGTINGGTSWVNISPLLGHWPPHAGGSDEIQFVMFSTAAQFNVVAGRGLELEGNTLNVLGTNNRISVNGTVDIDAGYVGQSSITTLGTITSGIWNGDVILSSHGGTGVDNADHTISLGGVDLVIAPIGTAVPGDSLLFNVNAGISSIILPSSGTMATLEGTETFIHKRITKRVQKIASNAQPSVNLDNLDAFYITGLSVNITSMSANLSGTPTDCQELEMWIRDNGVTGRTIAWGISYSASTDLPLPTITTPGMWLYLKFIYNSENTKLVLTEKLNNIS